MPTIIDELTMTLSLDPAGFKAGAEAAKAAEASLLTQMLAALAKIEQATKDTAANTTRTQESAADAAARAAERAESAQTAAAKKAARETEAAAKKTADDMRKTGREMEEAFGKVGNSIRRVGLELLAMMGISLSVSAVERLFSGLNRANLEAGYFAKSIGANVSNLSLWQNMAGRVGGTAEGIASAFGKVAFEEQQFKLTGVSQMPSQARDLFGVNMVGANGKWLQGDELTMAIAKAREARGISDEATAARLQMMGLGGLTNPILSGSQELERQKAIQQRTGNFVTPKDAEQAKQLANDLDEVYQSAMGLARVFWRELGPAIDQVVQRIIKWIDKNKDWLTDKAIEWGKRLGDAILKLADDFDGLAVSDGFKNFASTVEEIATTAKTAADAVGGWGKAVEWLAGIWIGSKVLGMLANMRALPPAIYAITAAIAASSWLQDKLNEGSEAVERKVFGDKRVDERKKIQEDYGRPDFVPDWVPEWLGGPRRKSPAAAGGGGASVASTPVPGIPALGLSMPTDLGPAVGLTSAEVNAFADTLGRRESGNRYDIMGGSSGRFAGRWQMGAAEIADTARLLGEAVPTRAQFLADPAMQDRFFQRYTLAHHEQLMRNPAYRAETPEERAGTLATAHLLGPGAAARQLAGGNAGADANGTTGSDYARTVTNAVRAAGGSTIGANAAQRLQVSSNARVDRSSSSQTHVGEVHVHTQATDANGIARDLRGALKRYDYATQSDVGLA